MMINAKNTDDELASQVKKQEKLIPQSKVDEIVKKRVEREKNKTEELQDDLKYYKTLYENAILEAQVETLQLKSDIETKEQQILKYQTVDILQDKKLPLDLLDPMIKVFKDVDSITKHADEFAQIITKGIQEGINTRIDNMTNAPKTSTQQLLGTTEIKKPWEYTHDELSQIKKTNPAFYDKIMNK